MKNVPVHILLAAFVFGALAEPSIGEKALPDAAVLLERIRESWTGIAVRMDATMTISKPEGSETSCELKILRAGDDRTRIEFLSPERHRGKVMLMAEGKLWLYLPRANKVTQIPRRRDPFGLSSLFNDLAFDESEISSATVTERPDRYQLELQYHRKKVHGPSRISFDKSTLLPTRCEFFSSSERLLRSVVIEKRERWRGIPLPSTVRVLGVSRKWKEVRLEIEEFGDLTAEDAELCSLDALGSSRD
jgi:outer membrane lipoprotein-sorting protein